MTSSPDLATPLGRARMLFALLAAPKLRAGLGALLSGAGAAEDPSVRGPLSHLDWVDEDGTVDLSRVRETVDVLARMRADQAILDVPRLAEIPVKTSEGQELSGRIGRLVFERVGRDRTLSEPELNAAIAMFVDDVARIRRDAVDGEVLTRTADGASYRLAETS